MPYPAMKFLEPNAHQVCATETRFRYWEPKPRSNFCIGIMANIFSEPETFFKLQIFLIFSHFLGGYKFL